MTASRRIPLHQVRRWLEPGPIVLVTSRHGDETDIMTLGWHMMLEFEPALVATYIWDGNHSHGLVSRSRECVINLPTADMVDTVVGIGNSTGADGIDKFAEFGLTPAKARHVGAPVIAECHAHFECRLSDASMVGSRGLFIWEVVAARAKASPRVPRTLHYCGDGQFMVSGKRISRRGRFLPQNL